MTDEVQESSVLIPPLTEDEFRALYALSVVGIGVEASIRGEHAQPTEAQIGVAQKLKVAGIINDVEPDYDAIVLTLQAARLPTDRVQVGDND